MRYNEVEALMVQDTHRIPDLKFYLFAIYSDHSGSEFYTCKQKRQKMILTK